MTGTNPYGHFYWNSFLHQIKNFSSFWVANHNDNCISRSCTEQRDEQKQKLDKINSMFITTLNTFENFNKLGGGGTRL